MTLLSLTETVRHYGLLKNKTLSKKLGQNFLLDGNLLKKIVSKAGILKDRIVVEVGPGPGGLSREILACSPQYLFAVEYDLLCIKALSDLESFYPKAFIVLHEDAASLDLLELTYEKVTILANLPYNIGTWLLTQWLQRPEKIDSITVMLQKEVAERIVASPQTSAYGRLSILAQTTFIPKILFHVPPTAFTPSPKVWSSVVHFTPRSGDYSYIPRLENITQAAFSMRRKMIRRSLKPLFPEVIWERFLKEGLIETHRSEDLSIEWFQKMAREDLFFIEDSLY